MLAMVVVTLWQFLLGLCAADGLPGGPCHLYNRGIPVCGFDSFDSGSTHPMRVSLSFDPNQDLQAGLWLYLSFCPEWLEHVPGTLDGKYAKFWTMAFQGFKAKKRTKPIKILRSLGLIFLIFNT